MEYRKKHFLPVVLIFCLVLIYLIFRRRKPAIVNSIKKINRLGTWKTRNKEVITDITIHHGASSNSATIFDYNKWHTTEKGWPSIGYHYVIYQNGVIHQVNELDSLTYHNGFNNTNAIGVCLVGNFDNGPVVLEQYESLLRLIKYLKSRSDLPNLSRCIGHKEYANKTACPGKYFKMDKLRNDSKMKGLSSKTFVSFNPLYYNQSEADN